MNDPRPPGSADTDHLGIAAKEPIGECATRTSRTGVHRQACRLVEHHDLVIFEEDRQFIPFGEYTRVGWRRRHAEDCLALGKDSCRLGPDPSDGDPPLSNPPLDPVSRDLQFRRYKLVESEARALGCHHTAYSAVSAHSTVA